MEIANHRNLRGNLISIPSIKYANYPIIDLIKTLVTCPLTSCGLIFFPSSIDSEPMVKNLSIVQRRWIIPSLTLEWSIHHSKHRYFDPGLTMTQA